MESAILLFYKESINENVFQKGDLPKILINLVQRSAQNSPDVLDFSPDFQHSNQLIKVWWGLSSPLARDELRLERNTLQLAVQ